MQIEGSVAFVTGSNRGLGRAIVEELLDQGAAKVYAAARRPVPSDDPRVVPVELDITDAGQVESAAALASDVDLLVNNAGIFRAASLLDGDLDDVRADSETNFFGTVAVIRAFAPVLEANGGGTLVNVLSVMSWLSFGEGYSASKAASWSATNGLRSKLGAHGTHVVAVHVGYMDTDMAAAVDAPKSDPRDVARQIVEGVRSGASEVLADATSLRVKQALSLRPEVLSPVA